MVLILGLSAYPGVNTAVLGEAGESVLLGLLLPKWAVVLMVFEVVALALENDFEVKTIAARQKRP